MRRPAAFSPVEFLIAKFKALGEVNSTFADAELTLISAPAFH